MNPVQFAPQLTQITAVKAALARQPALLHAARIALSERRRELRHVAAALKDMEVETAALIAGDPAFKNPEARKAAVTRALRESAEYKQLTKTADAYDVTVTNAEMDVHQLEDEVRACHRHVDLLVAEASLLVAGR